MSIDRPIESCLELEMENQQLHAVHETTTSGQHNSVGQDNSSTDESVLESGAHSNTGEFFKPINDVANGKHVFRQDIVRSKRNGMVGIVTEVSGDADSDSSIMDDNEDDDMEEGDDANENGEKGVNNGNRNFNSNSYPNGSIADDGFLTNSSLHVDQVRVLWMNESESTHKVNDLMVVDRGFLHGDFVVNASDPTGQVGVVVDVNISVDLMAPDGTFIKDISSKELKRVRDLTIGDYVVLGPWLGRIDGVLDNVTVMFDDGSMCKVMKAEPLHLKPVSKNILEDANFPYYPGQRVKASSSTLFKNSKWLSGLWKPNRLEGIVTKVTVGSVFVYWIASAGYGLDSSTSPTEEQSPKNLKLLCYFMHANWQLGDWCLFPSVPSCSGFDKGLSKLDLHDSSISELDFMHAASGCDLEEVIIDEINGNNESVDAHRIAAEKDVESIRSPQSSSCGSLLSVSKEPIHETWPLHHKKLRKVVVKRDKKAGKKVENFEKALLIVNTRTKLDVAWQDSSVESAVNSTTLIPVDSPGEHEFVAEQYVIEKASDDDAGVSRRVGVVKSVNAKERTASVRWLKPVVRPEDFREFDKEEIVSVYELEAHQDYDYCYGDVVVRLSPVSVSSEAAVSGEFLEESEKQSRSNEVIQEIERCPRRKKGKSESCNEGSMDFSDLSWVGNITNLKNGDIEVTWADGMVSTVGPQAICVVGREDDESIAAGSEVSEKSAGWETVDDNETEALEKAIIEDIGLEDVNKNSETEDSRENESNSALSVPLAALRFVTRLATGIFSGGQKKFHPFCLVSREENEYHPPHTLRISEEIDSIKVFIPETSEREKGVAISVSESPELLEAAAVLCTMRNERAHIPAPASYVDEVCSFKRFDITKDPLDHYFLDTNGQADHGRKWFKKVQQDWSILQNNLPDGIYVRVYEDRMDLLRAVIVGAYGTPYQDGLFFFDFHLTPEYPDVPPSAHYNSGGWRINPNLYEEGKVCLSLLNTWTGKGNEVWDPKSSSILQVLVSLQGLVLNSKPYFNEAGYDKQIGTAEGEKNSLSYNENTFLLNCKTMMYVMRKPPKDLEELIKEHFRRRGYFILRACDEYMKGQLVGSLTKDASASHKNETTKSSVGFKLILDKIFPKLFMALDEVGADCEEFKHMLKSS